MSNEKPVRITVGDVKEVAEATTIQADTVQPRSVATAVPAYAPQVETSNGLVLVGGLIGILLFIASAYFGFAGGQENRSSAPSVVAPSTSAGNAPATTNITLGDNPTSKTDYAPAANNAPVTNNEPSNSVNGPADKAVSMPPADKNAPAANNSPATNAPADANAPAANNAGK